MRKTTNKTVFPTGKERSMECKDNGEIHTIEDHTTIVHKRSDEKDILPFLSRLRIEVREIGSRKKG